MAREIEVRFKLDSEQQKLLSRWAKQNAHFAGATHHIEYYLDNPSDSFVFQNKNGFKDSEHYLRVRFDEKKGDSVCLKTFKINQEKQTSENIDEIEFEVSSGKEALRFFSALGYTKPLIIDKTRQKYITNDLGFEICFDDVKGLGNFVEIELREQVAGDIKLGWHKIYQLLLSIGIDTIDEQHRGYVSMLWNMHTNFGKIKKLKNLKQISNK